MNMGDETDALGRRTVLTTVAAAAVAGIASAHAETASAGNFGAPIVELHFPPNILTAEQKAVMIRDVSDVIVQATRLPPERVNTLWVQIFETAEGGWGIGGKVFEKRQK